MNNLKELKPSVPIQHVIANGATHVNRLKIQSIAFTMAEILLSLTIIGVVAAITLPSLTGNINEKTWNTQRKALYARISQAIVLMPSLNGYGIGATGSVTRANAAQAFITEGLGKVLKINNVCDNQHFQDCGIVSKYNNMAGNKQTFPTTLSTLNPYLTLNLTYSHRILANAHDSFSLSNMNAAAFETINGESIAVFYQPYCHDNLFKNSKLPDLAIFSEPFMCVNFIYDLNGKKGPNQAGKDIGFITAFYPTDSRVVMPEPLAEDSTDESGNLTFTRANALKICGKTNKNVRTPSREELTSIAINSGFSAILTNGTEYIMKDGGIFTGSSMMWLYGMVYNPKVRCIKR